MFIVRDNDTKEIFSLNVMPVQNKFDKFEAVHGLGYTKIKTESFGIAGEITYFVPVGADAEVASFIFSDGSPCDVTSRIEYKANKGIKVDVPLWMALATCNYINETNDMAVLDYMLGIQPKRDGIEINPCINDQWDYYEVTRPLRNATYNFKVHNPNHKQTGVEYIVVDGVRVEGNYVECFDDNSEHTVEVYM